MRLVPLFLVVVHIAAFGPACAGLDACPQGQSLVEGVCVAPPTPCPKTQGITIACEWFPDADGNPEPSFTDWELAVEPGPIVAGEPFGVEFTGRAFYDAAFLNDGQRYLGGYKRIAVLDLMGTVRVRKGATGDDVELRAAPIDRTCTYDEDGNAGPDAGPEFPSCSTENDNEDGSNDDCTGLGGSPHPDNLCLAFIPVETSDDCEPDGVCDQLGATGPNSACEVAGFCTTEPAAVPFGLETGAYTAAAEGNVLFGWDDENTGAILLEDGTYELPPANPDEPVGPNGVRAFVGGIQVVFQCTMAESVQADTEVVAGRTPDPLLISCPIEQP